jgi:selenocysteine lyase/cysteine desulfurase
MTYLDVSQDHGEFTSRLRQAASSFLGVGSSSDIALTPSTAQALSTVAASLSLKPGEYVVVLEQQSASNVMMWQALVDR